MSVFSFNIYVNMGFFQSQARQAALIPDHEENRGLLIKNISRAVGFPADSLVIIADYDNC